MALEPVLLETSVNGQAEAKEIYALRDQTGRFYVNKTDITGWKMLLPSAATVEHEGETYACVSDVEGLRLDFDEGNQRLVFDAAPHLFRTVTLSGAAAEAAAMTPPETGAFLNYDLFLEAGDGRVAGGAFLEAGAFTGGGFGTSSFVLQGASEKWRPLRLETSWTIDDTVNFRSLRFGDADPGVSRTGTGSYVNIPIYGRISVGHQLRGTAHLHHHANADRQRKRCLTLHGRYVRQRRPGNQPAGGARSIRDHQCAHAIRRRRDTHGRARHIRPAVGLEL
jgi:hypothetical protein